MNKLGVYKIINTKTNRWYVGSSGNIFKRWKSHKTALRKNRHSNHKIQEDWNIHGEGTFEFAIFQECQTIKEMIDLEQSIIDKHYGQSYFYNILPKVNLEGGWYLSDESKHKIRLSKLGKKLSKAHCESMSKGRMGVPIKGGWHHPESAKKIQSQKQKAFWESLTEEQRKEKSQKQGCKNHPAIKAMNRKRSKITYELAQILRAKVKDGIPQRELARQYDLNPVQVWKVIHNKIFVNP